MHIYVPVSHVKRKEGPRNVTEYRDCQMSRITVTALTVKDTPGYSERGPREAAK